jgi:hypothetical protein
MSDEDPQMWRAHANIASLIRALTAVELRRNEFERRSKAAIRFVETNRRAAEVVAAKLIVRETMVSTKPGTTTMGRRWQRLASDRLMRNYRRSEAEAKNQLRLDLAEWAVADAEAKALYVRVAEKQRKVAEVSRMRILTVTAARRLVRWEGVGPRCMLRRRRTRKGGVVVLRTILRQNTRHRSLLQSQVRNQVLFSSEWGEWTTNEKADRAAEAKAAADKEGRVRAAAVLFARPFTQVFEERRGQEARLAGRVRRKVEADETKGGGKGDEGSEGSGGEGADTVAADVAEDDDDDDVDDADAASLALASSLVPPPVPSLMPWIRGATLPWNCDATSSPAGIQNGIIAKAVETLAGQVCRKSARAQALCEVREWPQMLTEDARSSQMRPYLSAPASSIDRIVQRFRNRLPPAWRVDGRMYLPPPLPAMAHAAMVAAAKQAGVATEVSLAVMRRKFAHPLRLKDMAVNALRSTAMDLGQPLTATQAEAAAAALYAAYLPTKDKVEAAARRVAREESGGGMGMGVGMGGGEAGEAAAAAPDQLLPVVQITGRQFASFWLASAWSVSSESSSSYTSFGGAKRTKRSRWARLWGGTAADDTEDANMLLRRPTRTLNQAVARAKAKQTGSGAAGLAAIGDFAMLAGTAVGSAAVGSASGGTGSASNAEETKREKPSLYNAEETKGGDASAASPPLSSVSPSPPLSLEQTELRPELRQYHAAFLGEEAINSSSLTPARRRRFPYGDGGGAGGGEGGGDAVDLLDPAAERIPSDRYPGQASALGVGRGAAARAAERGIVRRGHPILHHLAMLKSPLQSASTILARVRGARRWQAAMHKAYTDPTDPKDPTAGVAGVAGASGGDMMPGMVPAGVSGASFERAVATSGVGVAFGADFGKPRTGEPGRNAVHRWWLRRRRLKQGRKDRVAEVERREAEAVQVEEERDVRRKQHHEASRGFKKRVKARSEALALADEMDAVSWPMRYRDAQTGTPFERNDVRPPANSLRMSREYAGPNFIPPEEVRTWMKEKQAAWEKEKREQRTRLGGGNFSESEMKDMQNRVAARGAAAREGGGSQNLVENLAEEYEKRQAEQAEAEALAKKEREKAARRAKKKLALQAKRQSSAKGDAAAAKAAKIEKAKSIKASMQAAEAEAEEKRLEAKYG